MRKPRVIALLGDSLLIDTIEAGLQDNHDLGIVRIHASVINMVERLGVLRPDLIIFDSTDPNSQFLIPFLRDQPDIPLLCLDITCSKVIAVSCEHYVARSASDLANLIELQTAHRLQALAA